MIPNEKKQLWGDVLIANDDVDICEALKHYCESMGCFRNILFAHDGSMAASKLRNQKFALVLLNLQMPKKGGVDILREMDDKSLNSKSNIVVLSGSVDKITVEELIAMGIKAFVTRPFNQVDFQEKILKLLKPK